MISRNEQDLRRLALIGAVVSIAGCTRDVDAAAKPGGPPPLSRGDEVVVERAAADFFEGRVLAVTESQLKVQAAADGEPVLVSRSDAYRLPPPAIPVASGDLVICNDGGDRWVGCRVDGANGDPLAVELPTGERRKLPRRSVIVPNAVTVLNVRGLFDEQSAQRRFAEAARRAGAPRRPRGWLPEPREPVLGLRQGGWYAAHVDSLEEEGGVRVVFQGGDRAESLPAESVVPVPPFIHSFVVGEFVLARPSTTGESWRPTRIEAIGPEEAVVSTARGERLRFTVRELVPLVP